MTLTWDQVEITEDISEKDQAASEDISTTSPVGKFLVTVVSAEPEEQTFKKYSCIAAVLKFRIDKILELEQPLLDDNGKQVLKNNIPLKKVQLVPEAKLESVNSLFLGQCITDNVNLYNPKEKTNMKNRRIFIAKKLRLIDQKSTEISTSIWLEAVGSTCIIETFWDFWEGKNFAETGKMNKKVKVKWDGYEFAPVLKGNDDTDLDTSFDTGKMEQGEDEEFDI
jgi:hypothetical protein